MMKTLLCFKWSPKFNKENVPSSSRSIPHYLKFLLVTSFCSALTKIAHLKLIRKTKVVSHFNSNSYNKNRPWLPGMTKKCKRGRKSHSPIPSSVQFHSPLQSMPSLSLVLPFMFLSPFSLVLFFPFTLNKGKETTVWP